MKLKTLNETISKNDNPTEYKEIRQEAIKWIKEDIIYLNTISKKKYNDIGMNIVKSWMERFNITEEDLKNKI